MSKELMISTPLQFTIGHAIYYLSIQLFRERLSEKMCT